MLMYEYVDLLKVMHQEAICRIEDMAPPLKLSLAIFQAILQILAGEPNVAALRVSQILDTFISDPTVHMLFLTIPENSHQLHFFVMCLVSLNMFREYQIFVRRMHKLREFTGSPPSPFLSPNDLPRHAGDICLRPECVELWNMMASQKIPDFTSYEIFKVFCQISPWLQQSKTSNGFLKETSA